MRISYIRSLVFLLIVLLAAGCSDSPSSATVTPDVIRIAPLPDVSPEDLRKRYQPLADYITEQTGLKTKLVIASSYANLLELFHRGEIDMANFGGVTFIKARQKSNALPLVFRDIDEMGSSVILVNNQFEGNTIQALKGKSFAFGSPLSTSGHLMPRYFFNEQDIIPDDFFSTIEYSGAHDKTALWVQQNKVFSGVANAIVVNEMFNDGRLNKSKVRVLWESPSFADYVWAIQASIAPDIKKAIESAFLNLEITKPEHKVILNKLGARYYITANNNDFSALDKVYNDLIKQGIVK